MKVFDMLVDKKIKAGRFWDRVLWVETKKGRNGWKKKGSDQF